MFTSEEKQADILKAVDVVTSATWVSFVCLSITASELTVVFSVFYFVDYRFLPDDVSGTVVL